MHETPLHWAAKRGYEKIISILIKYEADVFAKDLVKNLIKMKFYNLKGWKNS